MGELRRTWRWRRYQRGLRTIPAIVLVSVSVWALAGGGYFWPKWVILWAMVAMAFRAARAMREGPPDEGKSVPELGATAQMSWPPSRSSFGYSENHPKS